MFHGLALESLFVDENVLEGAAEEGHIIEKATGGVTGTRVDCIKFSCNSVSVLLHVPTAKFSPPCDDYKMRIN